MFVDVLFLLAIDGAAESYGGASLTAWRVRSTEIFDSAQLTFSIHRVATSTR